jgi:beta-1,4-N-acetylglucosaminyltransferase
MSKTVFVTTGATIPFIALLQQFVSSEVHMLLRELGFRRLVVQYGAQLEQHDSQLYRQFITAAAANNSDSGLEVVVFGLKSDLTSDIANADLVISHAGKKSILYQKKKIY